VALPEHIQALRSSEDLGLRGGELFVGEGTRLVQGRQLLQLGDAVGRSRDRCGRSRGWRRLRLLSPG
jgi:hypothetical protein